MVNFTFLDQAKAAWAVVIKGKGGHCPCCNRWGKIYPRSINTTMAKGLVWLAAQPTNDEGYVYVAGNAPTWLLRSNQLSTLKWWGLITRPVSSDPALKHSGHWRVTRKGHAFARNRVAVPKKVFTYDGEPVDFSDETVFIEECFGEYFNYSRTMGGNFLNQVFTD